MNYYDSNTSLTLVGQQNDQIYIKLQFCWLVYLAAVRAVVPNDELHHVKHRHQFCYCQNTWGNVLSYTRGGGGLSGVIVGLCSLGWTFEIRSDAITWECYYTNMARCWVQYEILLHVGKLYCTRRSRVQYHFPTCNKISYCTKQKCHICFIIWLYVGMQDALNHPCLW